MSPPAFRIRLYSFSLLVLALTGSRKRTLSTMNYAYNPEQIIAELRDKAQSFQEDGIIAALDLDAMVVKSDTIVSPELKTELRIACKPLEDIPTTLKDRHLGSDGKVLDLVDPSLFPLIYGRSRVLPTGKVGLQDCTEYIGKGEIAPYLDLPDLTTPKSCPFEWSRTGNIDYWSAEFQWLPCDVKLAGEGDTKIISYINNLHPAHHGRLYAVIESFISKSIPLWDRVLSSIGPPNNRYPRRKTRISVERIEYEFPQGMQPPPTSSTDRGKDRKGEVEGDSEETERESDNEAQSNCEEEDDWDKEEAWRRATRVLVKPEPGRYASYASSIFEEDSPTTFSLRKNFAKDGIQVIVKLANIELTPTKPEYNGGSWRIEGQLNEHICASALYYYDSENVTEGSLAFRHQAMDDVTYDAYYQVQVRSVPTITDVQRHPMNQNRYLDIIGRLLMRSIS